MVGTPTELHRSSCHGRPRIKVARFVDPSRKGTIIMTDRVNIELVIDHTTLHITLWPVGTGPGRIWHAAPLSMRPNGTFDIDPGPHRRDRSPATALGMLVATLAARCLPDSRGKAT